VGFDESGLTKETELPRRRWATQAQLSRETRRPPRRDRQGRDDPSSGRIGQELDTWSIPFWHDRPSIAGGPSLALT
jgi:hypothetical protein